MLVLTASILALSPAAQGELVLTYGQPVPGASAATPLNSLRSPVVGNDGTWAALAGNDPSFPTDLITNLLVKDGSVVLEEGVSLIGGDVVWSIEQPRVLDDGRVLALCGIGSLTFPRDAVVLDGAVVLQRGDAVQDASGGPIGEITSIREAHVTADERVVALAFVSEITGSASLRVLARDLTDPNAAAFSLVGPGDALPGGWTVQTVAGLDVAPNGRVATYGSEVSSTGASRTVYRVDGGLALEDGDPAPLPGSTYSIPTATFAASGFAVSPAGALGLLASVEPGGATTNIVASGASLVAVVGQAPVGSTGPAILDVAGLGFDMTERDEVVWVATDENGDHGIYVESERVLGPGIEVAGSILVGAGRGPGQPGFVQPLSSNGGFLTEIVELADGRRGLLLMQRSVGERLTCGTVAHSGGVTASIDATGSNLAGGNPLSLVATSMPPQQFGLFLTSRAFDPAGMAVASGQLCLTGTVGRFRDVLSSGVDGSFALEVDTQRLPQAILTAAQAGETWHFQAWFRDSAPTPTANFSDSVSVTFR